jgi:hypothetical protein
MLKDGMESAFNQHLKENKYLFCKVNHIPVLNLQVLQFFRPMNVGSGNRALKQSLETVRLNIHWVQKNEDVINSWLNEYLGR